MRRKSVALVFAITFVVVCLIATFFASGVLATSRTRTTSSVAATASLGVYSDSACTLSLTSTDWGTVPPGGSVTRTVYVKNLGSVQLRLSLSKTNWNPASANGPIVLNWNLERAILAVGQVKTATLTLSLSSSASGFTTFSVDAVISGQAARGKAI